MTPLVQCANGHEWSAAKAIDLSPEATTPLCPICGRPAVQGETLPSPDAGTAQLDVPTVVPDDEVQPAGRPTKPAATPPTQAQDHPTRIDSLRGGQRTSSSSASRERAFVPGYQVLEILGRGGMGVVYKAKDEKLDRLVALKMLHGDVIAEKTLARFQAEAQAIAHLHHPHIVQIHEIGDFDGRPYLSLEYVSGGSLARKLHKTWFAPRQAAQLVETTARAVHHAHEQGILHRDLKPGNILLTDDGSPKITDFGLAKKVDDLSKDSAGSRLTATGEILGTPSYMAPEQAAAMNSKIGPATDVYALGAILYELLTRLPPFEADTPMQTVMQVLQKEPTPPQQIEKGIPRDLQTICLTCLRKDPGQRYNSAAELATDLQAFLKGEPIKATPPAGWNRLLAPVHRRPVLTMAIGIGIVAVIGVVVGVVWLQPLAVVGVAVVSLLVAAWWYNSRLQRALAQVAREHQQAERIVERLQLLLETTQQLMRADTLDELLHSLSETTTRMADAERATIFLIDHGKDELWSKVALGEDVGEIRIKLGEGIAGSVALSGETVNIADAYADKRFNPEVDRRTGYKTKNLLTFPMHADNGTILGVFQILNKRKGAFSTEDVHALKSLAASAAAVVQKEQQQKKSTN